MEIKESIFRDKRPLPAMLEEGLRRGGQKTFIISQRPDGSREELSFDTVRTAGERLALRLERAGLRKGDRLGVVSALHPYWYALYYAAAIGGYPMVCIDPDLPVQQIHSMLRQTAVRAVFTTLPTLRLPAIFEGRIPLYDITTLFPLRQGSTDTVDRLLGPAPSLPEEVFAVLFASNTTGEALRGVLLPSSSVAEAAERHGAAGRERGLLLLPPWHMEGLLCAGVDICGAGQVILAEKPDIYTLDSILRELQPDTISAGPAVMTALMERAREALDGDKYKRAFVNALISLSGFLRRKWGLNWGRILLRAFNKSAFGGRLCTLAVGEAPWDTETLEFFLNCGMAALPSYGPAEPADSPGPGLPGAALTLRDPALGFLAELGPAAELRALLISAGGPRWRTAELSGELPLALDPLETVKLYAAVEEHFGTDLFTLAAPPLTFGALMQAVTEFDPAEKDEGEKPDLSLYPRTPSVAEKLLGDRLELAVVKYRKLRAKGEENIPAEGNCLFCPNHTGPLDALWVRHFLPKAIRERTAVVADPALFRHKRLKLLSRTGNMIPMDAAGNSMAILDRCRELLDNGWNVILFPEGSLYGDAEGLASFHDGPARLAVALEIPIVPVRIRGAAATDMDERSLRSLRGSGIGIVYGEPLSPGGLTPKELNEKLRTTILAL